MPPPPRMNLIHTSSYACSTPANSQDEQKSTCHYYIRKSDSDSDLEKGRLLIRNLKGREKPTQEKRRSTFNSPNHSNDSVNLTKKEIEKE